MKKARTTTLDERLKIVTECLANDKNYGARGVFPTSSVMSSAIFAMPFSFLINTVF